MKDNLQRPLLFIVLIFSILSFLKSFRDVEHFGDIDLRDKIVGARLLNEGHSPYYHKWQSGDDERLLDPLDGHNLKVSRVTAPPSLLLLFVPLAKFKHGDIQWIWFALSWLFMLIILFQFYDLSPPERKGYVLAAGLIFFTSSMAWQMHLERGQVYILFAALLSSAYWLFRKEKYLTAGVVFALLCWIRLPFIVCIPLILLFAQRKKLLTGYAASFAFLVLISFVFIPVEMWKDYFSSLQEWSRFQLHEMTLVSGSINPAIPSVIEGETNLGLLRDFLQNNRSVQCIMKWLFDLNLYSNHLALLFFFSVMGFCAAVFYQWKKTRVSLNTGRIFVFIFFLYILVEYFSPAPAYSYHYVQWLVPVLICLSARQILVSLPGALMLTGLAMNLGAISFIPYSLAIGEVILFAGIYLFSADEDGWF